MAACLFAATSVNRQTCKQLLSPTQTQLGSGLTFEHDGPAQDPMAHQACRFIRPLHRSLSSWGLSLNLEVEIERILAWVMPPSSPEIFVGMLGFSFSECPPAAGDLIGHDASAACRGMIVLPLSSPAEASSSVRFGPLCRHGQPDRADPPGRECLQRALHSPGRTRGDERFIVGDLALD